MRRSSSRWALRGAAWAAASDPPTTPSTGVHGTGRYVADLRNIDPSCEKSVFPINAPIGGMRMSFTSEDDLSECARMITPTAMSHDIAFHGEFP